LNNVLKNVITYDETQIFQYNPEARRQSKNWKTPTSAGMNKSKNEQVESEGNDDHFL
jgi:hypothetical protein